MTYKHTQFGIAILVTIGLIILVLTIINPSDLLAGILIVAIAGLLFCTLTITVDNKCLAWYYTYHFLKKRLPITEISAVKQIKTKWYYGYGTRYLPRGVLYNVSGFDAIEVKKTDGEIIMLGTDQPEQLLRALEQAIAQNHGQPD